ncbi:hypothetical protein AAE478_007063 [Parahypoxylon ruwenzoriense]
MLIYDRPWWAGISFTFSILEVNTGLICACAATFSPLFNVFTARVRTWTSRASVSWHNSSRKASISWHGSRNEKDLSSWRHISLPGGPPPVPPPPVHAAHAAASNDSLESNSYSLRPIVTSNAMPSARFDDEYAPYDLQGLQALHSHDDRIV